MLRGGGQPEVTEPKPRSNRPRREVHTLSAERASRINEHYVPCYRKHPYLEFDPAAYKETGGTPLLSLLNATKRSSRPNSLKCAMGKVASWFRRVRGPYHRICTGRQYELIIILYYFSIVFKLMISSMEFWWFFFYIYCEKISKWEGGVGRIISESSGYIHTIFRLAGLLILINLWRFAAVIVPAITWGRGSWKAGRGRSFAESCRPERTTR